MPGAILGAVASSVVGGLFGDDSGEEANQSATDANRLQAEIARDQWNRYKEVYAPLESKLVAEAQNYDTPEKYANAASEAQANVNKQFGLARDRLARTPGLDPSSGAATAALAGLDMAQAAQGAAAQNTARKNVTDMGWARKVDALGLGKGLPATASSSLSAASQTGLQLANAANQNNAASASAAGRVVDRVFSSPTVSNWLGNAGVKMGAAYDNNLGGGFGTGNTNFGDGTQMDLGAYL